MSRPIMLLCLASALGACQTDPVGVDQPLRGVSPANVPVVTRADYAFDLASPDGSLSVSEGARLDAWFRSLDLGYGDTVFVDGPYAYGARDAVAQIAGHYGMMVALGAPMTAGAVAPGTVRIVVARTRATVPNCPNWSRPSQPSGDHTQMPNFGCGVNSNLAAMIANPEDLIHGRGGSGVGDNRTAVKAVDSYRRAVPTGTKGLQDISTKGN
ncbi:MAG: CpaD family pilus assembly protein [Pseudomonadota bacterium]|nr:CpaD family pilus assembly protein [Pseudomonadota bacterium]